MTFADSSKIYAIVGCNLRGHIYSEVLVKFFTSLFID